MSRTVRTALAVLLALTLVRLLVAGLAPLSPDECYYWVWSRALAPGFLDHPPMVALWIRLGTALAGDDALGVRLLAPVSAALGTLALAAAAADLGPAEGRGRRALVAGFLLNATLLLGVGSVTMTPDTPLLFFWTLALAALGRVLATGRGAWWLVAGLATGLALDSKYTAVLTGAGLFGWLVATRAGRFWLRSPWPWLAALLVLALFAPVLDWNRHHHWASLLKQGGRTGDWHPVRAVRFESELLGGQLGLATPLVGALMVLGIWRAVGAGRRGRADAALLAWVTLVPVAVFVQHALGDRVQANWPGLVFPSAVLAAAALASRFWRHAVLLGLVLVVPVYVQSAAAPWRLPRALDVTLRIAGWEPLARAAAAAGPGFLAADDYGIAAELAFALPDRLVLGVEPRWALFALPHPVAAGVGEGLLLRSARRSEAPDPRVWTMLGPPRELLRERHGQVAERFQLFPVRLRADPPPAERGRIARMPAPR